jgi:hypothetical protein
MFENVQFFSHLHLKYEKSAIMTQKSFFLKNINMGIKKTQNFMLILNSLMPLTKVKSKKPRRNAQKRKYSKFAWFFGSSFFRGICLSRHQRIWNQHKILRFLIPILIFFKKNFFWVILALFSYFKCKCEKNCTFSNILKKVKRYFFANLYHSPFDSQ